MVTINIEGRKVKVDDAFLSMTPEQQNATVEEIAGSLGAAPKAAEPAKPAGGRHLTYEEGLAELKKEEMQGASGNVGSALGGIIEGVPIAGPALMGLAKRGAAGIGSIIDGEDYSANLKQADEAMQAAKDANPVVNTVGQLRSLLPPQNVLGIVQGPIDA